MADWPHAPAHRLEESGAYIVTAGTYLKQPIFKGDDRLTLMHDTLLRVAAECGWDLQAWAVFSNHYHFVAVSPDDATSLRLFIKRVHGSTAVKVNALDGTSGRKVWHQYWDTHLTYERSYLARLHYVHYNPVKHNVVQAASQYPWCSASWFDHEASSVFIKTVMSFPTDKLNVQDDFDVEP